jgi:hypothetical protein
MYSDQQKFKETQPVEESQQRVKGKVDEVLKTHLTGRWDEIRTR